MASTVVHLHILGESDQPEWCDWCCLPSALRVHYAITATLTAPTCLRSVIVCGCGWQCHG